MTLRWMESIAATALDGTRRGAPGSRLRAWTTSSGIHQPASSTTTSSIRPAGPSARSTE
jgi:hypothetical protein